MKKADLKPGVYIINYKGGDIFKIHNIISEDGKDKVWLVNTVTEKVISQGYNTVLKNYLNSQESVHGLYAIMMKLVY